MTASLHFPERFPERFPANFLWGAATSAYQVEGSPMADGAGASFWHRFSHTPGKTHNGQTGDIACDQYRRIDDDVRIMRELGLTSYRFSIAWGRIMPQGTGRVNPAGVAHYDRLVDTLLSNGIQPNVTLYHWDLPTALDDRGGWLNRDSAEWFADYARVMYRALDDRVRLWATLNEPWVVVDAGYLHGVHAPGHSNLFEAPLATHNLLRAHGAAVEAYRAEGKHDIGIVVNLEPKYAASDHADDVAATRRADAYMNRQYLDVIFHGRYPDELRDVFGEAWPDDINADTALIQQPIDWLGINYYTRAVTRNDPDALPVRAARVVQERHTHTEMDWEVYPAGLTDTLTWVRDRYGSIPLYVTENGSAFYDPPVADSDTLDDPLRVAYLRDHLLAVGRALAAGVDVRGYYAWSLLDNFEWSAGYSKRFGLVHVDFETQRRTLKSSALFYAQVIRSHAAALMR
ncbi:MAG: GH1 family beta-glucosidase [Gemmatimonadaceae bacterium]